LIFGAIAIFVYVGAEVSIGSFLVNYFSQPEIGGLTERVAANFVAFYWGGAMVGRFIGSGLLQKVSTRQLLGVCAVCAAALVGISMLSSGHLAMWSIILVGFFNSIMFPSIFTLGVAELGPLTGDGSGIMIMAIVGGAIIPLAQGWIGGHPAWRGSRTVVVEQQHGFEHRPSQGQMLADRLARRSLQKRRTPSPLHEGVSCRIIEAGIKAGATFQKKTLRVALDA
jgi:hypothetical protein